MMGMNLSKLHKLTPCFPVIVLILAQQNVFFRTHEERSVVFYPLVFTAPADIRHDRFSLLQHPSAFGAEFAPER